MMKHGIWVVIILLIVVSAVSLLAWNFEIFSKLSDMKQTQIDTPLGIFPVSTNAPHNIANEPLTKPNYIPTPVRHPVTWNIQKSPGYLQPEIKPYKSAISSIMKKANTSLQELSPDSEDALYLGLVYQITGDTRYANKTVQTLLIRGADLNQSPNLYYLVEGYDFIYQTKNVNSTLDDTNDTLIRDSLGILSDFRYKQIRDYNKATVPQCAIDDYYLKGPYESVATAGLVLSDYVNESLETNPALWERLGGDALFVYDNISTNTCSKGMLWAGYDYNYRMGNVKGFYDYGYTGYYDIYLTRWFNIYSNAHGHSIFQDYPGWEGIYTGDVWGNLPNRVSSNMDHSMSLHFRHTPQFALNLLNATDRSNVMWHLNTRARDVAAGLIPQSGDPSGNSDIDIYLMLYNFSNETPSPPTRLNTLWGVYNVIRSDWSNRADWLQFTVWNSTQIGSLRTESKDANQLAIEYYSHGDFLVPNQGDVKQIAGPASTYSREIITNSLKIGDHFARYASASTDNAGHPVTNLTTRSIYKGDTSGTHTRALHGVTIDSASMTLIEGHATIDWIMVADGENKILPFIVNYSRTIVYPKDYFVVIDRASSNHEYLYSTQYYLASLMFNKSTGATRSNPETCYGTTYSFREVCPYNVGNVYGTLTIEGTPIDWYHSEFQAQYYLPDGNKIMWNTTNPYGELLNTILFSVPKANLSYQKFSLRWGTAEEVQSNIWAPIVFFDQDYNKTLYRITAFITKYSNETAKTPVELAVTGIGSAMKIDTSTGTQKDYLYTGSGISTFSTFQTDADTAFIRKIDDTHITDYTLINGTFLKENGKFIFLSSTRLSISFNSSSGKSYANVSGNGETSDLYFYNTSHAPIYVLLDGFNWAGNWEMSDATTLRISSPLNDDYLEFDSS
jgi:hypothetical protein